MTLILISGKCEGVPRVPQCACQVWSVEVAEEGKLTHLITYENPRPICLPLNTAHVCISSNAALMRHALEHKLRVSAQLLLQ